MPAAAAGLLVAPAIASIFLPGGPAIALGAGAAAAGFFLLVAGMAAMVARLSGRPSAGTAIAGLTGIAMLASFHMGDPFIEWAGAGKASDATLTILHGLNPASGAVGHALDVDWLRLSIMYSGFPGTTTGGLSSAQYYYWSYFPWWGTAALHGTAGVGLLAGAWRGQPLRWAAE